MVEDGEVIPSKDLKPHKWAKITKGTQKKSSGEGTIMERVPDHCPRVQIWNPPLELDRTPFLLDSSIRDFQKGKTSYVADALEQPQLLPQDMVDLRTLKKHEVFLTLKRDLAMVIFFFNYFY